MLPFFFRHYDKLVDRYFIYDDGSTDATLEILAAHSRVTVRRFERGSEGSFVLAEQACSNACWKQSRGEADWVIVTDIDEHLCHADLAGYLQACRDREVTLVPALGFQMVSEDLPQPGDRLCERHVMGTPWAKMMKPSIFDPTALEEINFRTGRHQADPTGRVSVPAGDEMLALHYKYMGFAETQARHEQLRLGLGTRDVQEGWGHKYGWTAQELRDDWDKVSAGAVDVRRFLAEPQAYPLKRWWEKYRN